MSKVSLFYDLSFATTIYASMYRVKYMTNGVEKIQRLNI